MGRPRQDTCYSPRMSDLKDFLVRTPFFGGLPKETLDFLAGMLVERSFPAGAVVFREGEDGRSMYVVHTGELVANQAGESGSRVRLMRFFEGDFFGETTLIEMHARPFTVLVERDARLWELTNRDLYQLYQKDVKGYVLVLQNINRELCRRLRRAGNRITEFADETEDERTQIRSDGKKLR
jgi:CRP/FNR family cyclic AMP-dependent transcriptional regulator